jgi:hypothetical protein
MTAKTGADGANPVTPAVPAGPAGTANWDVKSAEEMNIQAVPGNTQVREFLKANPSGMIKLGNDYYQILEGGNTRTGSGTFTNQERHTDWAKVRDSKGNTKYIWGGKINDAPPKQTSNDITPFGF